MKLIALEISNYRTLQALHLRFPSQYTAICGPNDSGKTNVIRAIQTTFRHRPKYAIFSSAILIDPQDDLPKWISSNDSKEITIKMRLVVSKKGDTGLYEFLVRQLTLSPSSDMLDFKLKTTYRDERSEPKVTVTSLGKKFDGLEAQEVLKKLQSSHAFLFHNSTAPDSTFGFSGGFAQFHEIAGFSSQIEGIKNQVDRKLKRLARDKQEEIEGLLGRLENKYNVGLSLPSVNLQGIPINITLGEKRYPVPLDEWGSGTRNRATILMTLFRARQISESEASAEKITPVIVIEEPESFLHPSAQAEFGRVLQDLAKEFDVQVIVTSHSPYLLSLTDPSANLLLRRKAYRGNLRETELVETAGENWMQPFSQALGMDDGEFRPWRRLFESSHQNVLLVEGGSDREYFELLRDPAHGANKLKFEGEIVAYEGCDNLSNNVLLRFIKNKYRKVFITYDLDFNEKIERSLKSVGLNRSKDYLPIGIDAPGKKSIEGLLPENVVGGVHHKHPALTMAATGGTNEERRRARNELKKLYLEEFKRICKPGAGHFGEFYKVARVVNLALT